MRNTLAAYKYQQIARQKLNEVIYWTETYLQTGDVHYLNRYSRAQRECAFYYRCAREAIGVTDNDQTY